MLAWAQGERAKGANRPHYRNDPKFLDRQVWANSADPDQIAPEEQSAYM